ncbi:hypothetical protein KUCAC02_014154 [Chaenocephalus aceratus]|uniref:Uncharacterized protein n=1 Tax=Chaenocephalus aceratus TaxID=36190 RepID=A0ACB9WCX5_CHAAC|nr:hypothetical protein KUCAC02_014154 [Chaenocephalus aceratus]
MLITAIDAVVLYFALFFCSSDELNLTSTKNKNTVGNITWELLPASIVFAYLLHVQ